MIKRGGTKQGGTSKPIGTMILSLYYILYIGYVNNHTEKGNIMIKICSFLRLRRTFGKCLWKYLNLI